MPPRNAANNNAAPNISRAASGHARRAANSPPNFHGAGSSGARRRIKINPPHSATFVASHQSLTAGASSEVAKLSASVLKASKAPQQAEARINENRQSPPARRRR